ncbi:MAG: DUF2914 domain-containing protein [Bacteroidota bacterium]
MKNVVIWVITSAAVISFTASSYIGNQKEAAGNGLQIIDIKLGKAVQDKIIVDETTEFVVNEKVYLWIKTLSGINDSLNITWKQGSYSYMTKLCIGGSPWRTWTYKTASKTGDWTVTLADTKGMILKVLDFKVKDAK